MGHSLDSLYDLSSGTKRICPSESLSHLNPYLQYGELEKAADSVQEAKETLAPWQEQVDKAKAKEPSAYPNYGNVLSAIKGTIAEFEAQDYSAAQKDSKYLEDNGYC